MNYSKLSIKSSFLFEREVFRDVRGGFEEFWEENQFSEMNINFTPANACYSYNRLAGTLRGLHYQAEPCGQSKLVSCVAGKVWDVTVDLRRESPTFKQWQSIVLQSVDGRAVYIPSGCAHGFVSLEDETTLAYLIEGDYQPELSRALRWNDPELAIEWPVPNPILSDKDRAAPLLDQL